MTLGPRYRPITGPAPRRPYDRLVQVGLGLAAALLVGAALGALGAWLLAVRRRRPRPGGPAPATLPATAEPTGTGPDLARRVLDVTHFGVLVLDADDEVVLANPAARGMGVLRTGRLTVDELRRSEERRVGKECRSRWS